MQQGSRQLRRSSQDVEAPQATQRLRSGHGTKPMRTNEQHQSGGKTQDVAETSRWKEGRTGGVADENVVRVRDVEPAAQLQRNTETHREESRPRVRGVKQQLAAKHWKTAAPVAEAGVAPTKRARCTSERATAADESIRAINRQTSERAERRLSSASQSKQHQRKKQIHSAPPSRGVRGQEQPGLGQERGATLHAKEEG